MHTQKSLAMPSDINLFFIKELEVYALDHCLIEIRDKWTRVLVFTHFLPLFMTMGYYVISLIRNKIYIAFVGAGLLFNIALNTLLLYTIKGGVLNLRCGPI